MTKVEMNRPLAVAQPNIENILALAVQAGRTGAELKELLDVYERMQDRKAMMEFSGAMAEFQRSCPSIQRTSKASIITKGGAKFGYTYAELDEIARTVAPHLHDHGLSYSWDCAVEGNQLTCTCTLRHANGHKVTASFKGSTTTDAGMTEIQKNAAALTFARRQSLIQVLGLTTCDEDTDAQADSCSGPTITESQQNTLNDLIIDVFADRAKFLKFMGADKLADIPASRFDTAVAALEAKRKAKV